MIRSRVRAIAPLAVVLALVVALVGCSAVGAQVDKKPVGAPKLSWGVYVPDDGAASSNLDVVTTMAGAKPDYVLRFAAVSEPVPIPQLNTIVRDGATPIMSLEPWNPTRGTIQPNWSLATIAAGKHDADLTRWATTLAKWNHPLLLRFAHEMNGNWYPWAVGVNGNTGADFLAAWDHVHSVFAAAGADRVKFVWAPNVTFSGGATPFEDYYPGPKTVDYLGIDGYNELTGGVGWQSPSTLFGSALGSLRALPGRRPILVTETASSEGRKLGTDKATWIRELVSYLDASKRVRGFIWFQADKERDWRFNSTAGSVAAMKYALAHRSR